VARGRAALGGAAWIHDPDAALALELRHVRVAVHDHCTVGKRVTKPLLASEAGTGVVHDADPHAFDLHDPSLGERRLQRRLIHVSRHGLDRPERGQLRQGARRYDVAGVEHEIGVLQQTHALAWQSAGAARQVGVRDDGDERQRYFLRLCVFLRFAVLLRFAVAFAFLGFAVFGALTRKGLLTNTFVRVAFISA
jgi:hypothetical protein